MEICNEPAARKPRKVRPRLYLPNLRAAVDTAIAEGRFSSERQIALESDIDPAHLHRLMRCQVSAGHIVLTQLAQNLGTTPDYLLGSESQKIA